METMQRKEIRKSARFSAVAAVMGVLTLLTGAVAPAKAQQDIQKLLQSQANTQAKNLGLTPDQTTQLVQINGAALQQLRALKAHPPSDKKGEAKALKSIMDTRQAALGKILSPVQMKQLAASNQQDMASLMTDSMDTDLNLTDIQMGQVDKINLTYVQQMTSAMDESRKLKAKRTADSAKSDRSSALQQVLTPDQWKQYQALQQQKEKK